MVRTIVFLSREIKEWLDRHSKRTGKPIATIVHEALNEYKDKVEKKFNKDSIEITIKPADKNPPFGKR